MSGLRRLDLRGTTPRAGELLEVAEHLGEGGLVAYPTETVYGFGCALREEALQRLQEIKGRDPAKPFLLLLPEEGGDEGLRWTPEARELTRIFWPGALTLVLADPEGRFPEGVRSPEGGVAVRRSPHPVAAALVEALGEPLTSTSANPPGGEPARSGREAMAAVRALGAEEEFRVLDAGALRPSPSSTVVDCTGASPVVLRAGAIPSDRLTCVLPELP